MKTIADYFPARDRSTPESRNAARLELVRSILKRRQDAKEEVTGYDFDELMDLDMPTLFEMEVKDCDRIFYKKKGLC